MTTKPLEAPYSDGSISHMTKYRAFLTAVLGGLILLGGCTSDARDISSDKRPNIVVILADDMGYGDPGSYNPDSKIPTPNMDLVAAEGMRFTDAHSPAALCTPTRYSLLTGRYNWRSSKKSGVLNGYSPSYMDTTRMTMPSMLREVGYATAGVGKWHLGLGNAQPTDYSKTLRPGPLSFGFDYFYGLPASLDMAPYLYFEDDRAVSQPTDSTGDTVPCCAGPFWRAGPMSPGFVHADVLPTITNKAVEYLERQAARDPERPFFLYVALTAPHTPWLPHESFRGRSGAGEYGDFTMHVDAEIGKIMEAVDRLDLTDETLFVVASDNGARWSPEEIEQYGHRANSHFRGMKADIWEGGHRIPLIIRWPGKVSPGSSTDQVVTLTDLMATFAAAAKTQLPDDAAEDSYDLTPVLLGTAGAEPLREATIHHSGAGLFAIRQGPWKLVEGRGSGGMTRPRFVEPGPGEPKGQLYDLDADPREQKNLYDERPDIVEHLTALLQKYRQQGYSRPMPR